MEKVNIEMDRRIRYLESIVMANQEVRRDDSKKTFLKKDRVKEQKS